MPSMQQLFAQYPVADASKMNLCNGLAPTPSGFDAFDAAVDQVLGTTEQDNPVNDTNGGFMVPNSGRVSVFMENTLTPALGTGIVSVGTASSSLPFPQISSSDQNHAPTGKIPQAPTAMISASSTTAPTKKSKKQKSSKKKEVKTDDDVENSMKKPKRSLSAYNIFFQNERKRLLSSLPVRQDSNKPKKSHGKIGFADMARTIAAKWKTLNENDKLEYEILAAQDTQRYEREMAVWKKLEMKREMEIWRRSQAKMERQRQLQHEQNQQQQLQMMMQRSREISPQVMEHQMALAHAQKQQQQQQLNTFQW